MTVNLGSKHRENRIWVRIWLTLARLPSCRPSPSLSLAQRCLSRRPFAQSRPAPSRCRRRHSVSPSASPSPSPSLSLAQRRRVAVAVAHLRRRICSTDLFTRSEFVLCRALPVKEHRCFFSHNRKAPKAATHRRSPEKMKVKVVCRKIYYYVRYDLKEIAFPSSLPDPPHIKKRRKLTLRDRFFVLKEASRLYAASWVRDIGPELRPNEYKKDEDDEDKPNEAKSRKKEKEPSSLEDLAVAARGGMETLRPALQRVYMTRASAYRDALKSFIEGYQEGIQQTMEKQDDSKSQKESDETNTSA